jgi:hypothetical protein
MPEEQTMRRALSVFAVLLLVAAAPADEPKKDSKTTQPGKATWDLRAFNTTFRVVDTAYDAGKDQVTWVLETKEGVRTSDFRNELRTKPYVLTFYDADMDELATVRLDATQFKGIPNDRIMEKGTRLEVAVDVSDVLGKTKKVVLKRGGRE